jgi:pyridoxal phosphate enzyme (YggS family)
METPKRKITSYLQLTVRIFFLLYCAVFQIRTFACLLRALPMSVEENLKVLIKKIPSSVRLIAVSKTKSVSEIMEAYHAGQKIFGENRAQEMKEKYSLLPPDIEWHFIGHLQTNKVKYIADFVHTIQSIDSPKLLAEVDKEAGRYGRVISCQLQFHIATEETKSGFILNEALDYLSSPGFRELHHVSMTGVMGMASLTCDQDLIRKEFASLRGVFALLKKEYFADNPSFKEISMGMSGDYGIAIEEGSTMVRIGTAIFGERSYKHV